MRILARILGVVLLIPALLLALTSCSESPELRKNNDPAKYAVSTDVLWASPGGFELTMDIYTPGVGDGPYPVIVMFHGGGWLINDKSIMDQASRYLATNSRYVVCNVNYRLLADNDNSVTLNQIVEDAFGAVLWVKDNVGQYRGDPSRIAVTGDSAGGHLSAMIVNMGDRLNSGIFSGEGPGLRLTVDAASFAKLDVERVGQAVFGQSLRQNANDVVQFHRDGRLYFTPG